MLRSAEARLLLACARVAPLTEAEAAALRKLAFAPLDWAAVLELATRHGLRELMLDHLERHAADAMSREVHLALWVGAQRAAARRRQMARELVELVTRLEAADIPTLPLKGPALAAWLWGDVALRESSDLDLLVRECDLAFACALLEAEGFSAPPGEIDALAWAGAEHYHVALQRATLVVELHRSTDPHFAVEAQSPTPWWQRTARRPCEGALVRAFDGDELLAFLCVHGSKHHWSSLTWLVDVAELLRCDASCASRALDIAARLACQRRVALGLVLAHALLDAPLASAVIRRCARLRGLDRLRARIEERLFDGEQAAPGRFDRLALDLALFDRARERWRHAAKVLFGPTLADRAHAWPRIARLVRLMRMRASR